MHTASQIISFSSLIQLVVFVLGGPSCNLFGLFVWVVWNERDHKAFRNSENSVYQLLDKVKMFSYQWLRTTYVTLASNFHCWWPSLLLCLRIADYCIDLLFYLDYFIVFFGTPCAEGSTCFSCNIYIASNKDDGQQRSFAIHRST
jgi:hypothetical protein